MIIVDIEEMIDVYSRNERVMLIVEITGSMLTMR